MENNKRCRTLGTEKLKDIQKGFDNLYDKYRKKADALGYEGQVRMKREHGKLLFYVEIE
jgi:hypothetical protein